MDHLIANGVHVHANVHTTYTTIDKRSQNWL